MARKPHDRLTEVIDEIEALAKRLRTDLRRVARETGLAKNLQRAAEALRKRAIQVAALVERYAHSLRVELAKRAAPRRPAARRKRAA